MTPPDLAVHAWSAIPGLVDGAATVAFGFVPPVLQLSSSLLAGLAATVIAWLALLLVVAHGRYVTESVAAGTYRKGPFEKRNRDAADESSGGGDE